MKNQVQKEAGFIRAMQSEARMSKDLFICPLGARISARQCLVNALRVRLLAEHRHAVGPLRPCLKCQVWRRLRVYWPDYEVPDGRPAGMEVK